MRNRWRWPRLKRVRPKRDAIRDRRYTLMLIPEEAGEPVRQLVFTMVHLRRLITIVAACLVVGIVGVVVSLSVLPRRLNYESLLDENLSLKSQLREIEAQVEDIEGELLRVRYFRHQLENPPEDEAESTGPLDPSELEAMAWMDETSLNWMDLEIDDGLISGVLETIGPSIYDSDVTDIGTRMGRLLDDLDDLRSVLEVTEGQLRTQAESDEYLRTRWTAMPTEWPLEGHLTSGFGPRRSPFTGQWRPHNGIDISTPIGRAIHAPAPGVVIASGWNEGYGRMVQVDHGYGVVSRYAHMGRVVVETGDEVRRGQVLGGVGMTGRTTGPHLHYEIKVDGNFVDPMVFLR